MEQKYPLDLSLPKKVDGDFSKRIYIPQRENCDLNKSVLSRNILELFKNQQQKVKQERNLQKARTFKNILVCEVCKKLFDRKSLLIRHLRSHTGEKPNICPICKKGFSTSSSLNTHRRIHSGERPFHCKICSKAFTASSNLYYHKMIHTKIKPHQCPQCIRSFPTPGDLRNHFYVHSGIWPFMCKCGRGFAKKTAYASHLNIHK